jgi:hypothetical protein
MEREQGGLIALRPNSILLFIIQYLQARGWLRNDYDSASGKEEPIYKSEEQFWHNVIENQQIYETRRVSLEEFLLLEWIPLSPGQYHTRSARDARAEAQKHIIERAGKHVVYDPHGKTNMVKGGVGCLRLQKKQIAGEWLYFVSATKSGVAHRGILVGVPEDVYRKEIVGPLQFHGGIVCNVTGQIRHWPPAEQLPFEAGRDLPRLYLYAESITRTQTAPPRPGSSSATGVITFRGAVGSGEGIVFAYAQFDPSDHNDIERCARWLEENYVRDRYQGQVLTNFDEVAPRFENVSLPLTTVVTPQADFTIIAEQCARSFGIPQDRIGPIVNHIINVYGNVQGLVQGNYSQVEMSFSGE